MAEKLERKVMEIYGENAATRDIIAYGSDIAGNIVETKDPDVIQTEAYKTGVRSAVVGNNSTTLQNRQALDFLFSRQLKYLYQHGVAEWGADETYFVNSFAVGSDGNLYVSLTDNNKGNDPVTDTTNWKAFLTPAEVKDLIESYAAKKDLTNTNMITNCILSAPNGVMTISTPISEQLELSDDAVITDSQLTTGNAYFNTNLTKNSFDKDSSWTIKTTFKITKNATKRNIVSFQNFAGWKVDGINSYDYLEIFGVVYSSNILKFNFLGGYNDAGSFIGSSKVTAEIQLNTEYTATYSSNGHYSLYQGDTKIKDFLNESYAFSTLFSVAQNSTLGTLCWDSKSGDTPINFNGTNITYNSGAKTVPVVGDPYTLTVNKGLKVALANGYNADGTPKSEIVTLENDVAFTISPSDITSLFFIFLCKLADGSYKILLPSGRDFGAVSVIPSNITGYKVYLNTTDNKLYEYGRNFSNIYDKFVMLGSGQLTNGQITQVFPYKPIQLSLEGLGDYVVESQVLSDGSWYRKYKSGWLEQGGKSAAVAPGENTIVTFSKAFANTTYTVLAQVRGDYTPKAEANAPITAQTKTGFTIYNGSFATSTFNWRAIGQGAN